MINGYVYDYVHRNIIGDLLLPSSYTTNWKKYTYTIESGNNVVVWIIKTIYKTYNVYVRYISI